MKSSFAQHYTIQELADKLNARIDAPSERVAASTLIGVNTLEAAQQGEVSFLANPKYAPLVASTQASALIVHDEYVAPEAFGGVLLRTENPYNAFLRAVQFFYPSRPKQAGFRHPSAIIAESAQVHASANIGANVVIGEYCTIGEKTTLHGGVILYDSVHIANDSTLHANVVCYDHTIIGSGSIIHAGTVLGADGFGFAENKDDGSFTKIPQVGNVVIGDDVEIGANCTIDRAALGSTRIENGVKLDNLIHVAHNVIIGENTAIAAQTGISGSTKLGKRNRVAGQVGFVGHIATANDVTVNAQSGVAKDIAQKGVYFGTPAKPFREELRIQASLKQLPEHLRHFPK